MKIFIDAEGVIFGRLGSFAAKELLKGNEVVVVNSEKAIISGSKKDIVGKVLELRKKGGSSQKGPKISMIPERFLKRKMRGMLPWDKPKGRQAYKRLKCYSENPLNDDEKKQIKKLTRKKPLKFLTIKQIVGFAK